ncbi:MAG TPA: hypothetical protein VE732_00415, partial [Nitrososphaera sp.]|nr:hypothetical protein [Nitrososphaera sp.]
KSCAPGRKSSVLIEIASIPPRKKRVKEKIMYSNPISVWCVENRISHNGRGFLTSRTNSHQSPLYWSYIEDIINKSILFLANG